MPAAAKSTNRKPNKHRKKTNLNRLYNYMNKLIIDAVDNEIMKRFRVLIDSCEEDLPKSDIDLLINNTGNVDISIFPEGLLPYVRHFLFMVKRDRNQKLKNA